ncbi:Transposon Tf2-9 polyprotein [Labeo rohita]|uniref:ribonuclease H n=1 Tax=Labeo rohita TaxID=84645 RepID=A0ABQ8LSV7_LABRO|nr:Transposon Tf2-9 polyprotein [Labeo rohita]
MLTDLRQGNRTVSDYSTEFRKLAAECRWNEQAQWDVFLHGLADRIQREIFTLELPADLDGLIDLALRVDARLQRRDQLCSNTLASDFSASPVTASTNTVSPAFDQEPMQVGRARLSREERERQRAKGLCLYCGAAGHFLVNCPLDSNRQPHSTTVWPWWILERKVTSWTLISLIVFTFPLFPSLTRLLLMHLMDKLSPTLLTPQDRLPSSRPVTILRGSPCTSSPLAPIVLGHPWLVHHNPRVDWGHNSVSAWSDSCYASCLVSACSSVSCSLLQNESVNLSNVPKEYLDLKEVFSKSRAACLPPHRPYDCAIDLVPGTSLPKGKLYSLSAPEREAMEKYISDSLAAGFIRPSSSPAGAGFFFVGKKDGSLRPCIDYRGLNNIIVKNTYPLPLMSSAFERLQGASIFTKLDLRNTYHLVRIRKGDEWKTAFNTPRGHFEYQVMPFGLSNSPAVFQALVNDVLRDMVNQFIYVYLDDILIFSFSLLEHVQHVRWVLQRLLENGLFVKAEKCFFHAQLVPFLGYIISSEGVRMDPDKVKAVVDWPTPESRKALQRFLWFANFYRRFIRNFSQLALPLTTLTSAKTTFRWSSAADSAFTNLKSRFVSAPILVAPDPTRQFVVEVDASEVGDAPRAFFSRRLSPAERNYDIGNRELLAVKLVLEEWRHWLEGSGVPFIVWTDHKNLEYIRSAKRLNSRQARWALFFGRFDFSISYRPGSKNIKSDALSHIFDHSEHPPSPESIIPGRLVVSTLSWEIELKVRTALEGVTPPPGCPPGRLFVPEGVRPTSFGGVTVPT